MIFVKNLSTKSSSVISLGLLLLFVGTLTSCKNDASTSGAFESRPLEATDYVTGVDSLDFGLQEGYTYRLFDASEDYLVWFEYTTGTLHVYNVNERAHQKTALTRGRGPTEYHSISSLAVVGETVYLGDMTNGKVLAFNIPMSEVSRVPLKEKLQIFRLAANGEKSLFFGKMFNPSDWTGVINLDDESVQTAPLDALDMTEEFPNLYYQDGTMTISGPRAIWATLYRPILSPYQKRRKDKSVARYRIV